MSLAYLPSLPYPNLPYHTLPYPTLPYPTQFRSRAHEQEAELARAVADKAAVTHAMWQELRDKEADLGRALALGHTSVRPSRQDRRVRTVFCAVASACKWVRHVNG